MTPKNTLKYLLTTVSTLAITIGAANEAAAAPTVRVTTNGGLNQTVDGAGFLAPAGFVTGDSILLGGATDSISINSATNVSGIDLNGKTPTGTITASVTGATLGSIGNGAGTMPLIVNNNIKLTLSGTATVGGTVGANNYSGLGAVTLGSTAGGAANTELDITDAVAVTFTNTFDTVDNTTANWATLNISNANHIFNGIIGGHNNSKLGNINILTANTITFGANVTATNISLANNSTMKVGTATINAAINGAVGDQGTLSITGGNAIFTEVIGGTSQLLAINIADTHTGTFNANASALTVTLNGDATMAVGNGATIHAAINGAGLAPNGTLSITGGNATFYGIIGGINPLLAINIADGDTGTFNANATATAVTLTGTATMVVNNATINAAIDGVGGGGANGTLSIAGGNGTFTGVIGANHPLSAINIAAGNTGTFNAAVTATAVTLTGNAIMSVGNATINAAIDGVGGGAPNGTLNIAAGNAVFNQLIGGGGAPLALISVAAGHTGTFNANVTATAVTLTGNAIMSVGNATINAAIDGVGGGAPNGTLSIAGGNGTFTGIIGGGDPLALISVAAGHTGTFNANVTATAVTLTGNATMVVSNATIDANINGVVGGIVPNGTLSITGNSTFSQAIGASTPLLAINIADMHTGTFDADVTATNVTLTGAAIMAVGNGANINAAINGVAGGGGANGTLSIAGGNGTFTGIIGGGAPLALISVAAGHTGTFNANVTATNVTLNGVSTMAVGNNATINAAIDGVAGDQGTLSIAGGNGTFTGTIGANHPLLAINIADTHTGTFNANASALTVTLNGASTMAVGNNATINAAIDGVGGGGANGTLSIAGGNGTFTGVIGGGAPLALITIAAGNTGTFNADVTATNVTLGNGSTMVANGNRTITAAIAGAAPNDGTLNISGGNVIFGGKIGGAGTALALITVADGATGTFNADVTATNVTLGDDSTMAVNGARTITAAIDGAEDGSGDYVTILNITGGNAVFNNKIGSTHPLQVIDVIGAGTTATFNDNVTSNFVGLGNGSIMIANGNNATINATIDGLNNDDQGTINIINNTTFTQEIGETHKLHAITVANGGTGTFNADVTATTLTLTGNATMVVNGNRTINAVINGAGLAPSGTLSIIGNATFNKTIGATPLLAITVAGGTTATFEAAVTATNVTLVAGSTFVMSKGSALTSIVDGPGTLVLANPATAVIGNTNPLNTVRLVGWAGAAGGVVIQAATLDLTGGTVVKLDADLASANITAGITSSDNSSIGFAGGQSYAVFAEAFGTNIAVSNLGVATKITGAGTLSATSATPTGLNKVMIDFWADGKFSLAGNGTIDAITNSGANNEGTFEAQLAAGETLVFSENIGADGARIQSLDLTGIDVTSRVNFANANIYAQNVSHDALTIDATAAGLNIHSDNYTVTNTTYNIGTQTVKVMGGNVTLAGNIAINASFVAAVQPAVDISAVNTANLNVGGLTHVTFEVTGGAAPARDTIMIMITPLAGDHALNLTNDMVTLAPSGLWALYKTTGQLIFNETPAVAVIQAAIAHAEAETGATNTDIADATKVITTTFGGQGLVATASTIGGVPDQQSLNLYDPQKFTKDLSTSDGAKAFLDAIGTANTQKGFVAYCDEQIILAGNTLFVSIDQAAAYAIVAKEQGFMTDIMADAISNNKMSGIEQPLVQDILKVSAINGPESAKEMSDRITHAASNSANTTLDSIGARSAFVNLPVATFSPSPSSINIGSSSELLYAEGEGVGAAAGDSPYDRFGIWGSVNGGTARQKERKGNDGFRSTSTAFVVGIDSMVNDYTSLGFAAANAINHIKHKNASDGNKTDAKSWIGSLYGNHHFQNNWLVRGTALVNHTHISNKERRIITGGYGIAQSKYNLLSYGGEANIGYYYQFKNDIVATPTIGLRVLHSNKISYAETGSTNQNHKNITQKAMNNYSALAALSLAQTIFKNDISFTPEAHANFQYGINAKSPKGSFVSPLMPSQTTSFVGTKPSKLTSIYGLSMTASNDKLECGLSGDITIASKYVGYQGGIKLKVKF